MRSTLFVFICLVFSGCAVPSSNIPFTKVGTASSGHALIYIYRPHHHVAGVNWPIMRIGNSHFVPLADSAYTSIELQPGKYVMKPKKRNSMSREWGPPAEFDFAEGKVYFIRFGIVGDYRASVIGGVYSSNAGQLPFISELVSEDKAITSLAGLHYLAPDVQSK